MSRLAILLPRLLVILFVLGVYTSVAQTRDFRKEAVLLKNLILQQHYHPKEINDEFSKQFYDELLKALDPDKIIFSESDLKPLLPFRAMLDDEFNGKQWSFFNILVTTYRKCLKRSELYVEQLSSMPFNWKVKEYLETDTVHWSANEIKLREKWRLWLKFSLLDRLATIYELDSIHHPDFFNQNELTARTRVKASELRSIRKVLNHQSGFENYVASIYFGTFISIFDPHSAYLSTTQMENFLSSLSTEGYYFGVTLDENDRGDVIISALAPGGPAWKSGEFQAGDVLLGLTWTGQEPVDLAGVSLEEVNQLLTDANHNSIEFTIKVTGGIQKSIPLRKEKISLEEVFVRSYILAGKNKIGYISLPDFYTQWGDESEGSRCASDVAKEVIKLKRENIEGLILDVRFNGGGSLQEAMAMAGIFIDEGPLGILRDGKQNETTLKDMNRGTVYDGPLVLMVNGQSASASEFLAAALQDYNRGLIVGSRTYGKATAQNFFPLDPNQKDGPTLESIKKGAGFATITTDKIYRVTGKTAQGLGITPDILLPDFYDLVIKREAMLPYALLPDSVYRQTYYKPRLPLPRMELRKQSTTRVSSNASFKTVEETLVWLKEKLLQQYQPDLLQWDNFLKESDEDNKHYTTFEVMQNESTSQFKVTNGPIDFQRIQADEYAQEFNKRWIERLKTDAYVEEAFLIVCDYIDWKKKNNK
ncbi:MAG TPA: carboxy terminal-processing peptidase [Chryseolinea sp.]|nr:carboxy terminal-processing peptidase [Chryseolinea sp.]